MKITALTENTAARPDLGTEHGLSIFIETQKHRIVCDFGASALFAENAEKLGIDIASADIAVLSHGHYDHGGGLGTFLEKNSRADVYVHQLAFGNYSSRRITGEFRYIGLDQTLKASPRIRYNPGTVVIDDELTIFSDVHGRRLFSETNRTLLEPDENGRFREDRFLHEQNLAITSSGKRVLISGCAHNGIVNILERFSELFGEYPDIVVSGFHLSSPGSGSDVYSANTDGVAEYLLGCPGTFYTCHCTGMPAFNRLCELMGSRIRYFAAGDTITV